VYPHLGAWEGIGEDTKSTYSACQREISQNISKKNVAGIQFISKINPTIYPATLSFGWMFFLSTDVQPD
jgi:hypothetical protein